MLYDVPAAAEKFNKKYGDLYEFYMGSIRVVVVSKPDLAEKIWASSSLKNTKFVMRNGYSEGIVELGLGTKGMVLNRDIDVWNVNRKFMNVISSPPFLRESINLTSKMVDQMFEYWKVIEKKGMQIEVSQWIDALGAEIVSTTATGKGITAMTELFNELNIENNKSKVQGAWQNGVKFTKAIHLYNESMSFMMLFPTKFRRNVPLIKDVNKKYLDNRDWIYQEMDRIVSERQKEIENTPLDQPLEANILTLLLTTNTERDFDKISVSKFDRPLTNDEVISILREVFTGGLDTTSNSLSYLLFYLAKHRDVYLKMRQEVLDLYYNQSCNNTRETKDEIYFAQPEEKL
ncbi:767_t:CDS:2, partial [Racocetra fulgida]